MVDYEKQAKDFLIAHGMRFSATYLKYDKFFEGDTDERDIYILRLYRGNRRFETRFGNSIINTRNHVAPTAYDLLACLTKSDPGTFENFCSDMGYSSDSRKAEREYNGVVRAWKKVSRFFTQGEIIELQEIN